MKKRYPFHAKNWLHAGLFTAFAVSFSLNLQAQTAPAKLWDKTIGGSDHEQLSTIQQTADGGYILGGGSGSPISGDKSQGSKGGPGDYWVIKLDINGKKIWDKTIGGSSSDGLSSLQQTSDGGYILGGESDSPVSGDKTQPYKAQGYNDYWIVKLNANGNKIWDKTIGGNDHDFLRCIKQTSDRGYILGGESGSTISGDKSQTSKGGFDYWIAKVDANGNKIWDKTIGGNDHDFLSSMLQTSDGGYILGGFTTSGNSGDKSQGCKGSFDYWVIKLNANGNKIWDKTFGGNDDDRLISLQQTTDGGYILGGTSRSGINGDKTQPNNAQGYNDYWIIKIDGSGNKQWDKTFGGDSNDFFTSLQQTKDGGYILGGESASSISGDKSQTSKGGFDYWIVKVDANGNKQWDQCFGGNQMDYLSLIQQTTDNGYILGGSSGSDVSGDKSQPCVGLADFWVVKLGPAATGMNETLLSEINLYPNPTSGLINLELKGHPTAQVSVYNTLGQCILKQTSQEGNMQLDLSNEAKGFYSIQIVSGNYTTTRKIVVQ